MCCSFDTAEAITLDALQDTEHVISNGHILIYISCEHCGYYSMQIITWGC